MRRAALLLVLAASVAGAAWWVLGWKTPALRENQRLSGDSAASATPQRPSAQKVAQWLQASNSKLVARAEDYQLNAPRQRDKLGQPLPFRTSLLSSPQVRALRDAGEGAVVSLELFPDINFRLKVGRRLDDKQEVRIFASLESQPAGDRFAMSWSPERARGLVEVPSRNAAYEILQLPSGAFEVREWLYTDVVCARVAPGGDAAEAGMPPAPEPAEPRESGWPILPGEVPILNSRPSAIATIYLDFDGEVVSGTAWVSGGTINALPARMGAAQVEETWRRVANHFGVFDVNVTTDRAVYDNAPPDRKTHCIITPTKDAAPAAGGVAYLDSFIDPGGLFKICWTFNDQDPAPSALIISHEVGHTLNLRHHGRVAGGGEPFDEYYRGHGTGETGWGPFMGAPYGQNLLQWSKGEYQWANNSTQDDLAIISVPARIPFLPDDHASASATATPLVSGVPVNGSVEQNTDADFFRVSIGTGPQPVAVSLPVGTMMDVELQILAEDGSLLQTVNPVGQLAVATELNFSTPRTVLLRLVGSGKPDVLTTGYSAYSSLGAYTLVAGNPFPAQVTGVTAKPFSDSAIDLAWTPATGAASYIVRRNGADLTNTAGVSFRDTGLAEQTAYSYTVVGTNGTGAGDESAPVVASTLSWVDANPYGFQVTNPSALSATGTTNFAFAGRLGSQMVGSIVQWTNVGRAVSGYVDTARTTWGTSIPLMDGTNRVVFSTSYARTVGTNDSASDTAGDAAYASGWAQGANGGFGFGPWSLAMSGTNASAAMVDNFEAPSLSLGTSFRGFALRARLGTSAVARRTFNKSLAVGESFSIHFDSNLIDAGRSGGFALADAGGTNRFTFSAVGGLANYYAIRDGSGTNTNTGITYTTNGLLPVTFTLVSSNTYRLVAGTNAPVTNTLAAGGPLSLLSVSNYSAGTGEGKGIYFGDLRIRSLITSNQPVIVAAPFVVKSLSVPDLTDGLPTAWWASHAIPSEQRVASADFDQDGSSNAEEHAAGTDPKSPSSRLAIVSVARSDANVAVTWTAVPGKTYFIQTRTALEVGGWTTVEGPVIAGAGETNLTRSLSLPGEVGFVRILVGGTDL